MALDLKSDAEKQCDDIHVIQAWCSQVEDYFRTVYLVSVDIIIRTAENLTTYDRLFGVLVFHR